MLSRAGVVAAPRLQQAEQGHLEGEQPGLGVRGLVQQFRLLAPDDAWRRHPGPGAPDLPDRRALSPPELTR